MGQAFGVQGGDRAREGRDQVQDQVEGQTVRVVRQELREVAALDELRDHVGDFAVRVVQHGGHLRVAEPGQLSCGPREVEVEPLQCPRVALHHYGPAALA